MNRPSPPPPPPPPRRRRSERLSASEEKSDNDFVAVEEPIIEEPIVEEPIVDDNEETVDQPQPLQPQVQLQQDLQLEAETAPEPQQEPEPLPQPQLLQPVPVQQVQAPIIQQQQQQPIIAPMPIPNHNENEEEYEMATLNIRSLRGERIRILVYPGMMQEDLAQSIAHAALAPAEGNKLMECWSGSESFINWSRIAGMFRERDNLFVPLSILLRDCHLYENDMFRVPRRSPRDVYSQKVQKTSSAGLYRELLLYVIITSYVAYKFSTGRDVNALSDQFMEYMEVAMEFMINLPFQILESFVDYPLRELYRNGPAIIGWEGQSLALICAQVTHMGDESFWSRNMSECEKIYATKERAALYFRRPLVFMVLFYILFLVVRSLVHARAVREQNRPPPEMVEIYRTFKMVMKVIQRGMNNEYDDRRRRFR